MKKIKKLRYSLATYYHDKGDTPCCDLTELAEILASGPSNIPERINLTKATELHHLGMAFLQMKEKLKELDDEQ